MNVVDGSVEFISLVCMGLKLGGGTGGKQLAVGRPFYVEAGTIG